MAPACAEQAIARAAEIVADARQPVFLSAGTDVAGMRALLELAERAGGIVDHVNSDAVLRNLLVLQDTGWVSTTLTEVRNRCDLLVVAGSDISSRFPRLFERCLDNRDSLFDIGEREILFLGTPPAGFASSHRVSVLEVSPRRLGELFAGLRCTTCRPQIARTRDRWRFAGSPRRTARSHAGGALWRAHLGRRGPQFPACRARRTEHVRAGAGDQRQVALCRAPTRRQPGRSHHDAGDDLADRLPAARQLRQRRTRVRSVAPQCTASARTRGSRRLAVRERVRSRLRSARDARPQRRSGTCRHARRRPVYIPVATPGLHHAGHLFRTDNVVAIRLRQVGASPSVAASALSRILEQLGGRQ